MALMQLPAARYTLIAAEPPAFVGSRYTAERRYWSRTRQSELAFLPSPGVGQCFCQPGSGEIGPRGAVDERRNDPRRGKGERRQQADVSFGLAFARGDLGKG